MQFELDVKRLATKSEPGAVATVRTLSEERTTISNSLVELSLRPIATAPGSDFADAYLTAASQRSSVQH